MTPIQSLSISGNCSRPVMRWLWVAALAVSVAPWMVVAFKLLLVAIDAPLALIEAAVSAIFVSIPVSACFWLGLTVLTLFLCGWRRTLLASIGLLPLGMIYFITITWLNR